MEAAGASATTTMATGVVVMEDAIDFGCTTYGSNLRIGAVYAYERRSEGKDIRAMG